MRYASSRNDIIESYCAENENNLLLLAKRYVELMKNNLFLHEDKSKRCT